MDSFEVGTPDETLSARVEYQNLSTIHQMLAGKSTLSSKAHK